MGLVEEEWLETLGAVNVADMQYVDFIETGRMYAKRLKVRHRRAPAVRPCTKPLRTRAVWGPPYVAGRVLTQQCGGAACTGLLAGVSGCNSHCCHARRERRT